MSAASSSGTSSSADRMRASLSRRPAPGVDPAARPAKVPRVKPVRSTLDLPPTEHRDAKRLVLDLEAPSLVALCRALLVLAREDPDVAARVRAQLESMAD